DGDRGSARTDRCGDRRGRGPGPVRPPGQHGSRLPHRVDGPDPARLRLGADRPDALDPVDPVHLHRRGHHHTGARRPLLGGQRTPTGTAGPGHHHRRPTTQHLHRSQPTPGADPRHRRNPRRHPPPHRGHPATRRRRHRQLPHQPQHHPHHPTTQHPPTPPNPPSPPPPTPPNHPTPPTPPNPTPSYPQPPGTTATTGSRSYQRPFPRGLTRCWA